MNLVGIEVDGTNNYKGIATIGTDVTEGLTATIKFIGDGAGNYSPLGLTTTGAYISGATAGGVFYAGTNGQISQSATTFFWDRSNSWLGLGTNAPISEFHVKYSSTAANRGITFEQTSTDALGARVNLNKSRNGAVLVTGDVIGRVVGWGFDGTNYVEAGRISFNSTGTIGTGRMPSTISFSTNTDAATSVMTTALLIGADQSSTFTSAIISGNGLIGTYNSLTTGNGFYVSSTSLTTGSLFKFEITAATAATVYNGVSYTNSTAATSGNQQYSLAAVFSGKGYATGSAASQDVSFRMYVMPVQGSTVNGSAFITGYSFNGAGWTQATGVRPAVFEVYGAASQDIQFWTAPAGTRYGYITASNTEFQIASKAAATITFYSAGTLALTLSTTQNATFAGSITTAAPTGGAAAAWKLGGYTAGILAQGGSVLVNIAGTDRQVLTA